MYANVEAQLDMNTKMETKIALGAWACNVQEIGHIAMVGGRPLGWGVHHWGTETLARGVQWCGGAAGTTKRRAV